MTRILHCAIVSITDDRSFLSTPDIEYRVYDKNNLTVARGVSSTKRWIKHDAGGYHTKEKLDKLYSNGWRIIFDF